MLGQHETHFNNWKAQGNHSGLSDSSDTIATKPMEPATDALTEGLKDAAVTSTLTKKKNKTVPFSDFTGGNSSLLCLRGFTCQCPNVFEKVAGKLPPKACRKTDNDIELSRWRKKVDELQLLHQSVNSKERQPALKSQAVACHNHRAAMHKNGMNKAMAIKMKILHQTQEEAGTQQVEVCKRHKDWKKRCQPTADEDKDVDIDHGSDSDDKMLADPFVGCLHKMMMLMKSN